MNNVESEGSGRERGHESTRGGFGGLLAAVAALGVASLTTPALADDCGWGGVGFGISISSGYGSIGYAAYGGGDCYSIGYSSPVYVYGGPRYYNGGGYYPRYGGGYYYRGGGYYDNCGPRYYRPSYRNYYYPSRRYYYNNYRYDNCSPYYWSGGYSIDGVYTASAGDQSTIRYRIERYAGDQNLAPDGGFKVVRQQSDLERAADLDPQWAGGAIAMLRKGEADEAIVALENAAYPEAFALEPEEQTGGESAILSDMGGTAMGGAASGAGVATPTGNPEAMRMLGLALIADGQIDEGAAQIVQAYRLDANLASTPIDERLFPSGARFDVRDLVRKVSVRANRTDSADAWFTLGVLMQAEDRDSVALDMVLKASAAGLDQALVGPMADALRRVVYGRG